MRSRLLFLTTLAGAFGALAARSEQPAEAGNSWPDEFRAPAAKVLPLDAPDGVEAAYETAHFRLYSDDPIGQESLERFATVIESVPRLLQGLPLPLWAPPGRAKPVIRLCRDEISYQMNGGPGRSPGFYNGRKAEIIIRADVFLNPPRATPSRLAPKPDEDMLVHELTHLAMHGILVRSSPWFYEGAAEYMAAAHRQGGSYSFRHMDRSIRNHVRRHLRPGEDGTIPLPSLSLVMEKDSRKWGATNQYAVGNDPIRQYAVALLLVHYHLHGKARRAKVRDYLERLAAHRDWRLPLPTLATEPPAEIEDRLQRYWGPRGLNLKFTRPVELLESP